MTDHKPKSGFFDLRHPFFRPIGVRIVVVVWSCGWGVFEFITGSPFWALLFICAGLYAGWAFFLSADKRHLDAVPQDDQQSK